MFKGFQYVRGASNARGKAVPDSIELTGSWQRYCVFTVEMWVLRIARVL